MALNSDLLAELERIAPGRVSMAAPDRAAYARDLWPRGLLAAAAGDSSACPPDAVIWPTTTAEVAAIVRAAAAHTTPIVPFGAGSGVCGGALPLRGGLIVDMKRMNRLLAIDETAGNATFEAGLNGDHLEHALGRRGLTLGHFPSSIMCSTFGGWLATRSAGQLSTRYGKIEDMVQRLTLVDGRGEVHELESGARPDLVQLVLGSEGTLGVLTEATCSVWRRPELQLLRGWGFARVSAGCEAIRRLLQRGLRPAVVRLYDELDTLVHRQSGGEPPAHVDEGAALERWLSGGRPQPRRGLGELKRRALNLALRRPDVVNRLAGAVLPLAHAGCLLVVGFEGDRGLAEAEAQAAASELERAGGRDLGEGPGRRWLERRYAVSFGMSKIFDAGAFVDTMEVATTWERLLELYRGVREALAPLAFVMAHFSHAYSDGCSIYFTFLARGADRISAEQKYDQIWRAGLSAVVRAGGTISHHHGIGLAKASFMPDEHGDAMAIYRALKDVLDPQGVFNPGKMGL